MDKEVAAHEHTDPDEPKRHTHKPADPSAGTLNPGRSGLNLGPLKRALMPKRALSAQVKKVKTCGSLAHGTDKQKKKKKSTSGATNISVLSIKELH